MTSVLCQPHRMGLGQHLNKLRPRRDRRHFADDIFKCIFLNENERISLRISLKFVPKGPMNNNPALVQIMAWRRPGDKPLSESMLVRLPTHICVTRPQWVNLKWIWTISPKAQTSLVKISKQNYCQVSNIRRTKFQNLNVSCLVLQLPLCNLLKPGVKLRMKM